ncbi:MAG: hypothetical protein JOZ67_10415 [Gammaproteobacteria bacterium]|nr:hypothetical protein [Gammaproteobacteria bacterium]MBV9696450.1 hypothetical protein [Gammaproteobacteria bacterium]
MSAPAESVRSDLMRNSFALWGGPAAWFVQLNLGYAWASWPCFPHAHRLLTPVPGWEWTTAALAALILVCVLVAAAAWALAWQRYRRTAAEPQAGGPHDIRARACFVSLWGVAFGAGFCLVTLLNAVALFMLPRCGG